MAILAKFTITGVQIDRHNRCATIAVKIEQNGMTWQKNYVLRDLDTKTYTWKEFKDKLKEQVNTDIAIHNNVKEINRRKGKTFKLK